MQRFTQLKIQNSIDENLFINSIIPKINSNVEMYTDYFFTRKEENQNNRIDLYFNSNITKPKIVNIENSIKQIIDVKTEFNYKFNDTQGKFGPMGDELLTDFYKCTNEVVLKSIGSTVNDYNGRLDIILELFLVSAHYNYESITSGYFSFASHVNGFFTRWKNPNVLKEKFNNIYLENKEYVFGKIENLIEKQNLNENSELFKKVIRRMKSLMRSEIEKGNMKSFDLNEQKDEGHRDFLEKSPFHNLILENPDFIDYMNNDRDFLTSRLITVFTYLMVRNLGLRNLDRYLLCYLIYKAVEEKYNLDTMNLVRNFRKESSGYVKNK
ncbi:hypothetical protein [Bacillus altitudinis]|uniref:hypothetical protein n=1 Tax=Bacillus altitudinis TaxID=293387 RepID=UPI0012F0A7B7|nr:hypothetical protein [Bacillus altitudinis]MCY7454005.1 hypothetical protein [Bacillus altitudinis]VXC34422.1 conserved hypothetical protein [Bacillus altitudinis]